MKILRQAKTSYYGNLDMNSVLDNKKLWRTVKPFVTDKVQTSSSITLVEDDKIITNDSQITEIFNDFLTTITQTMDMPLANAYLPRQTICCILLTLLVKSINMIPAFTLRIR